MRAPTGHGDTRGSNDVELKPTLLSRPIAPSTVISMPACFHITLAKHLKSIWREGLIPGGLNASSRVFTFFNPYVPWDPRSWKVTKSVDTRRGGYVCLYVPNEVLMNEFNGRLTDSGQVVTDQIIPFSFSKVRGGWTQDSRAAWDRLIAPSGDDQVVRIGRVRSSVIIMKESVLRLAKQCLSVEKQPYDELTMDAMNLVSKFENHEIQEGGKEQYEGRVRLVDYILEKKPVTQSGCRYCPHCLKETPTVFAICLECWTALESHGIKPYRITEEEDEDEATKRQIDEEVSRHKETIFKNVVHEAQESAAKDADYGFDPSEVDYDEGDEEMQEDDEDEEVAVDEPEEEDNIPEEANEPPKVPKWSQNLEVGSKRLPTSGLINNDTSEGAAQLFDNAVVVKIMSMYKYYYRQRVLMTPEEYRAQMTTGTVGRLDLDGICPYTGENEDGTLRRPSEEELDVMFRAKAKKEDWMQGESMYGGRPRNMLMPVVKTLEIYEKLMESLVLAGFKPEDLQFLIPMHKMKGTQSDKNEMRAKISDFIGRLLKSAFPSPTQYTYFRSGDHGFEDCIEIPALSVYLAYRENERTLELLVTAAQCNVILPHAFIGRIAHAVTRAEQEAARGHMHLKNSLTPHVDPSIAQYVYKSIGDSEGAKRAIDDALKADAAQAAKAGPKAKGGPKSYAPKPPPPKVTPTTAPGRSSSSSAAASEPAKSKPAYKAMPTAAKSTRPSPGDKPQQTPQYKKIRTD